MNSLREQLVHHLFLNKDEWVASGTLQRMTWRNRGKTATPRSVVRRLEEAENMSLIAVSYDHGAAQYRWIPYEWRHKYVPSSKRTHSNILWIPREEERKIAPPSYQPSFAYKD